jgi:hypothetical protein
MERTQTTLILMIWYFLPLYSILRCYWGYSFENLATENSLSEDGGGIDANVEYCSVIKTKLGAHRIIMGAEMDCCDATDDGRRFYVELKTSREVCFCMNSQVMLPHFFIKILSLSLMCNSWSTIHWKHMRKKSYLGFGYFTHLVLSPLS